MIVEDDEMAVDHLISILSNNLSNISVMGIAKNVSTSIHLLNKIKPDLVFMDIKLQGGTAFDVLDKVEKKDFDVVFVTAHDEFLRRAIEHYAFYYLLKPFDKGKLLEIIAKYEDSVHRRKRLMGRNYGDLQTFLRSEDSKLLISTGYEHVFIRTEEIVKCVADGNYTHFHLTDSRRYHAYHPLKYFEQLLEEKGFFRASRKQLINLNYVKSIYKRETLILTDGEKITIATRNKGKLSRLIQLFT
ncbi:MAG: LytTR family DNA-binding domain-containing protein [Bacteroidota bacterium]